MRYIAVQWHHDDPNEPVKIYSEIDDLGWEQRKIEVFADGHFDYAEKAGQSGSTQLGLEPLPSLTQIATDPQFTPEEIPRSEFEDIWKRARF